MERTNMCAHRGRERPIFFNKKVYFSCGGGIRRLEMLMLPPSECNLAPNVNSQIRKKKSSTVFASDRRRGGGRGDSVPDIDLGFRGSLQQPPPSPAESRRHAFSQTTKMLSAKLKRGGVGLLPPLLLKLELAEQFNSSTPKKYRIKLFGNTKTRNNNRKHSFPILRRE